MKKNIFVALVLMSLLLFLVGCQTQTAPVAQPTPVPEVRSPPQLEETPRAEAVKTNTVTVTIENFKFMPTDAEIKVGDTVEWVNKDSTAHTVSLDNGNVDQELPAGGSVTYTFTEKGEYGYTCRFHPSMKGKVIVN